MDQSILNEVFLDQIDSLLSQDIGIKRDVDISKAISTTQIVVVSGIRRSGKSTLMRQLMEAFEDFCFLNFDDERLMNFEVEDFQKLMIIFKKYNNSKVLFFDEIQNVFGWERFIRRVFDEGYKIFITGSNAKLLSAELGTHLSGRYIKIELYPFSFIEVLNYKKVNYTQLSSSNKAIISSLFDEYLNFGGFPELIKYNDDEFLQRVYEDIIYRDLIARYKIRNIKQFKNLSQYLFTNFTGELSYNSLRIALGIKSTNTTMEYVSYLEESYLLFELYKYDYSLKKQYVSNKKIYAIDNGVRNKISFRFSDDKGKLLENLVFVELKRRQKEVYFFKTKNNREIDFLYYEDGNFVLIQVAYSLADYKTKEREIKAILEANKTIIKAKNIILSYDEQEIIEQNGVRIEVIPVWKWLLE